MTGVNSIVPENKVSGIVALAASRLIYFECLLNAFLPLPSRKVNCSCRKTIH
uniref:Uncharacterized protein n=1 Tax=Anguilla anguilla TaxID=7936 RepID=A0A0E9SEJ4_ANGAN